MKYSALCIVCFAILAVGYAHVFPLIYQPSATLVRSPAYTTYSAFEGYPYQSVAPLFTSAYQPIQFQYLDAAPLTYPNYYVHNFVDQPFGLLTPQQQPIEIPLRPITTPAPISTSTPANVPDSDNIDKDINKNDEVIPNGSDTPPFETNDDSKKKDEDVEEEDTVAVDSAK